jgi:putative PEP-CTERM system TPR-repeat lipoprotein
MTRFGWVLLLMLSMLPPVSTAHADDQGKAARFFEDALSRYERDDYAGAVVQLKNVLQLDPRLLQAHVLLGRAELQRGNPAAAEISFDNALKLGADRSVVVPELAQAYFGQGKYQAIAERINPVGLPAAIQQDLLLLRAYAYMELGDKPGAETTLAQAERLGSTADYLVAQGMFSLQQQQLSNARKFADQALTLDRKHAKAWNLLASIDHLQGATDKALRGYATALLHAPTLTDARVARAGLLLDMNRLDDLQKELAQLKTKSPGDPRASYLESVLLGRQGKTREAKAALLETAKLIDSLPPEAIRRRGQLLMLGALANYEINSTAKAQGYLESYIKLHPDHPGARKMLGSLYLREQQTAAAVAVLEKAIVLAPGDADLLMLLASAYLTGNQPAKAANLLEQAGAATRGQPDLTASLGVSLLGVGRFDSGLQHLTQAFRQRPADGRIGSALVMLHIQHGQPRAAVGVAEALVKANQPNPQAYNLLGVAKAAAADFVGARAAYEKALALAPNFDAARLNLGKLETAAGRHEVAQRHFAQLIQRNPRHSQAQYELARNEAASNRMAAAITRLEKLRSVDSGLNIGLTLGDYYLAAGQSTKALNLAKELSGRAPDHFEVLSLYGRSQAASGRNDLARVAFRNMGVQAGADISRLAETARLQLRIAELEGATLSLNKALSIAPDDLSINLLLIDLELRKGARDQATGRASKLAAQHPARAEPLRVLGDIAIAGGKPAEAVRHYRAALSKSESAGDVLRLVQSHASAGEPARGLALLEEWNRRLPNDATIQLALAEGWMRAGKLDQASAAYERHIKQHGEQAPALNNLALLLLKRGDLPAALRHAERAHALAPDNPITNDTLGWILTQKSETDRALRYLRDARLRAPGNPEIQYHLATALQRTGKTSEAIRELQQALKSGVAFEGIDEARGLLRQLQP